MRRTILAARLFMAVAIHLFVVCTLNSVGQAQQKPDQPVPNELPRSWSVEEIAKATPPYGAEGKVYVLAWAVREDQLPFRVEICLAMKVLDKDDGYGRWCLAHLYRHPADKNPEWRLSAIHVTGAKGTDYYPGLWILQSKRFKEQPGNKQVYAACSLVEVGWTFENDKGWRFVSCCVCEQSWKAAIGEKPTRFFGK
ncbi:MAG TPA: hypothetical protein VGZ47_12115 [Gemmataceae bacterium]|jgi:hypothetical protein|nr:hypothetical protein [Gemmataceae bacterium]